MRDHEQNRKLFPRGGRRASKKHVTKSLRIKKRGYSFLGLTGRTAAGKGRL